HQSGHDFAPPPPETPRFFCLVFRPPYLLLARPPTRALSPPASRTVTVWPREFLPFASTLSRVAALVAGVPPLPPPNVRLIPPLWAKLILLPWLAISFSNHSRPFADCRLRDCRLRDCER